MPIYTCKGLVGNQKPILDFAKKGLDLTSSSLSAAGIIGHPDRKQLAFAPYVQNLPDFMYATWTQTKVVIGSPGHALEMPYSSAIQYKAPPVGVSFKTANKPADGVVQDWMRNGGHYVQHQNTKVFVFPGSSGQFLESLIDMHAEVNTRCPAGVMNIEGYSAWVTVWKIITLFLSTHTYPAFMSKLDDPNVVQPYGEVGTILFQDLEKASKKARSILPSTALPANIVHPETELFKNEYTMTGMVAYAKPAPFYPNINYGPPTSVPSIAGIVFPYFHGLINPDFTFAPSVIARYFLGCLGNDRTEILSAYNLLKRGMQSFAESPEGLVVAHILQGIQLSLECQARLFLIIEDNVYGGFVLLGYGFAVRAQDKVHTPIEYSELQKDLLSIVSHKRAVQKIVEMLNGLSSEDNANIGVDLIADNILTARQLHHEFHRRTMSEDEVDTFLELAKELAYPERYLPIAVETLCQSISQFTVGVIPPLDAPMHIGGRMILRTDDTFMILSQYGPMAPSFITVNGDRFPISKEDQEFEEWDDPKKRLPFISVTGKPLTTAIADWNRMFKDGDILMNTKERAGASRTKRFTGDAMKTLWAVMKENIPKHREAAGKKSKEVVDEPDNQNKRSIGDLGTSNVVKKKLRLL